MNIQSEIRKGTYYDSVVLMQLQRALLGLPGVADAGVVMATPANRELLEQSGLLVEAAQTANPDDLLIVVKAESETTAKDALSQVDALLAKRRSATATEFRPRSVAAAAKLLPEAQWALISVPGRYAASVAREGLNLGKHIFLYSDNVELADEIELKRLAQTKGLLVMGPDCGTAIINGVGLGFANHVRRGNIGLVGASGTGLQTVTSHIHQRGAGVSHAIGTGGRDLKAEVGALTAHQALDVLARDPDTKVIVLISKPPAPEVATRLLTAAQTCGKPVVVNFIGYPPPARTLGNLHFATSLSESAELAVQFAVNGEQSDTTVHRSPLTGYLRGLFSGGTLAYEAMLVLQTTLFPLYSNSPISSSQAINDPLHSVAHSIIDMGGDEFTVGRLHPMMDNDLRVRRIKQEAADPAVGLILLDVVLGESAHPNPAGELAPAVAEAKREGLEFVAIVVGTDADPQNMVSQVEQMQSAGCKVFTNPSEALAHVSGRFSSASAAPTPPVSLESFSQPLAALNIGVESFHLSLQTQGAQSVQVDWRPPAAGNEKLAGILAKMKKK